MSDGNSTIHHDHVMTSVSFSTIKTMVKTSATPTISPPLITYLVQSIADSTYF